MGKVRIIYFITRRKVKQYRKNHWIPKIHGWTGCQILKIYFLFTILLLPNDLCGK